MLQITGVLPITTHDFWASFEESHNWEAETQKRVTKLKGRLHYSIKVYCQTRIKTNQLKLPKQLYFSITRYKNNRGHGMGFATNFLNRKIEEALLGFIPVVFHAKIFTV